VNKFITENFSVSEIAAYQEVTVREYPDCLTGIYRPQLTDVSRLHSDVVAAVDAWRPDSDRPGLGIIGPTGIGKTRVMYVAIRKYGIDNPKSRPGRSPDDPTGRHLAWPEVEFLNECDFAEAVSNSFNYEDKEEQSYAKLLLSNWREADVLFLDDVGQAKYTERVQSELYRLIEHRTSNGKPFLWTSNYDAKGLLKKFPDRMRGKAILRRLKEFCMIVNVND
jgi:DNA replication protein DnaC